MFLFCDGFDGHAATADLARKWAHYGGSGVAFNSTAGRYGGGAAVFTTASGLLGTPPLRASFDAAGTARFSLGFSMKVSATPASAAQFLAVHDYRMGTSTTDCASFRLTTSGYISFYRWNDSSATATGALNVCDNAWHWIEIDLYLNNVGGFCVVTVDGTTTTINYSGDTISGSSDPNFLDRVSFLGISSQTMTLDDVVCYDDITGALTGDLRSSTNYPLGPCRIPLLKPNGAGSSTDLTPSTGSNYQCVDEASPNFDTDYVSSSTAGHDDLYTLENTSISPTTIYGVVTTTWARYTETGALDIAAKAKSSAATVVGPTHTVRPAYFGHQTMFPRDPNTSAAWGTAGIDAAEFGFELV